VDLIQLPVANRAPETAAGVTMTVVAVALLVVVCRVAVRIGSAATRTSRWGGNHLLEEPRQLIRLDLEELDVHLGHIHRRHRQAATLSRRQDHATAGEVERRGNGRRQNRETHLAVELAAIACLQTGLHADHVAGLRLDVREEEQARVVADHPGAGNRLAAGQRIAIGQAAALAGRGDRGRADAVLAVRFAVPGCSCLRLGRHLEHLQEALVISLGLERHAEGHCQCRRSIQLAVRAVDHGERRVAGIGLVTAASRQVPDCHQAAHRHHDPHDQRQHLLPAAPRELPCCLHVSLPGNSSAILAGMDARWRRRDESARAPGLPESDVAAAAALDQT